jgi:catechol 2,3-dioxygenase-like lactoylglutathione lyase family enzyme
VESGQIAAVDSRVDRQPLELGAPGFGAARPRMPFSDVVRAPSRPSSLSCALPALARRPQLLKTVCAPSATMSSNARKRRESHGERMIQGLDNVEVITLFVEDLPAVRAFYRDVFGLGVVFEDDVSTVLRLKNLMINLLDVSEARALMEPVPVAARDAGARLLLTIAVEDVNAVCEELRRRGVELCSGPVDRPWGRRTAAFADPAGNVWEIAQSLER